MIRLKKICFLFILGIITALNAEIVETTHIKDILSSIDENSLVLFDMDDTLTDSSLSLGSGAWRQYIREKIPEYEMEHTVPWVGINLHDILTYHVAQTVPVIPVEQILPQVIIDLQKLNIPVLVLTARGTTTWYSSEIKHIDELTFRQLNMAGYDFSLTTPPVGFDKLPEKNFKKGVLFANGVKKGPFLKQLFEITGYRPYKVVFIDDKLDQVQSVGKTLEELGIPYVGFWYNRATCNHEAFDPVLTTLQLSSLLNEGVVMSNKEALDIKETLNNERPDQFFIDFLGGFDFTMLLLPATANQ